MSRNVAIKHVSFSDVVTLPAFNKMTQFDLLPRSMDNNVYPYLFKMGIDIDKPVLIQACKHRNFYNQPVLGYRYVGNERTDRKWLNTRYATINALIAAQTDGDLAGDLMQMSKEGQDWSSFKRMAIANIGKEGMTSSTVPQEPVETYAEDIAQMKALREIQMSVRQYLHPEEDMLNPPPGTV